MNGFAGTGSTNPWGNTGDSECERETGHNCGRQHDMASSGIMKGLEFILLFSFYNHGWPKKLMIL